MKIYLVGDWGFIQDEHNNCFKALEHNPLEPITQDEFNIVATQTQSKHTGYKVLFDTKHQNKICMVRVGKQLYVTEYTKLQDNDFSPVTIEMRWCTDGADRYRSSFMFNGHLYWVMDANNPAVTPITVQPKAKKVSTNTILCGTIIITEKQAQFLEGVIKLGKTTDVTMGEVISFLNAPLDNPISAGAVMSTLKEKGIIETICQKVEGKKVKKFTVTDDGTKVLSHLKERS